MLLIGTCFVSTDTYASAPTGEAGWDDGVRIRICWKGPKGKKTCITVEADQGFQQRELQNLRSEYTKEGTLALSGFGKGLEGHSFSIDKSWKIEEGKTIVPGNYTITKGQVQLKMEEGGK